jgi:hypothetical protein
VVKKEILINKLFTRYNDYVQDLTKKNVLIVVSNTNVRAYSSVLIDILNIVRFSEGSAKLVWYEDVQKNSNKTYRYRSMIKEINQRSIEYCKNLETLYAGFVRFEECKNLDCKPNLKIDPTSSPNFLKTKNPELLRSIHADWFGKNLKTLSFSVEGRNEKKHFRFDIARYNLGFGLVNKYIQKVDVVILPNGKYPHQVGMKQAALESGKDIFFYERDNNRTFLQKFQTQDFEVLGKGLESWINSISKEEKHYWINWSEIWLAKQRLDMKQNIFLLSQDGENSKSIKIKDLFMKNYHKVIPIFTSSLDEKISNLPVDLNGWQSQVEAISICADQIKSQGFIPHVRLHPNLERKSLREMIEIFKVLEIKKLSYQFPWEGPSTYWLLRNSKLVVTWGATVALEALADGVSAINLGPSRYNYASGISTLNPKNIKDMSFENIKLPDRQRILLTIYALKNYGLQHIGLKELNAFDLNENDKVRNFIELFVNRVNMLKMFLFDPLKLSSRDFIRILSLVFGRKGAKTVFYFVLKTIVLKSKLSMKFNRFL